MFIGMSKFGVYAMPALVEENSILPEVRKCAAQETEVDAVWSM